MERGDRPEGNRHRCPWDNDETISWQRHRTRRCCPASKRDIAWLAKQRHVLVRVDGEYRMKEKWVYFINNDTPMTNLTFLV